MSLLVLFCSIYHPVAISWVVNQSKRTGRALGVNGIFGGFGIGFGALLAGFLIEKFNWQTAFIAPGILSIIIGFILLITINMKYISVKNTSIKNTDKHYTKQNLLIIAVIMLFAMFGSGLTFQIMQTSIPKVFDLRIENISTFLIGLTIGVVYGISGLMTLIGGILADKFSLKKIYVIGIAAQVPCFFFIAFFDTHPVAPY